MGGAAGIGIRSRGNPADVAAGDAVPRLQGAARRSRADAFRHLVGAALDGAYGRAAVLLGDRFEAEDAVHDAAERAWRRWGSLRDADRFEAWFGRIVINECRDRLRRRRRVVLLQASEPARAAATAVGPDLGVALAERDRIARGMATLSVDERIAIVLRYDADLTVPAIAEIVGVAEGTVKSRLHYALAKLRLALEDQGHA